MELRYVLGRVDAELVREPSAKLHEDAERPGPVPGEVQRSHEEQAPGLTKRLAGDGHLREFHGSPEVTQLECRAGGPFERLEVQSCELGADGLRPFGVGVFDERLSAPPPEGSAKGVPGARPVAVRERHAADVGQPSELLEVDKTSFVPGERVPAGAGRDEARVPQGPPCPVDQHLQVRDRVGREVLIPQRFGQGVLRDELAGPAGEHADEDTDPAAAELACRNLLVLAAHDEAAQQPYLQPRHDASRPRGPGGRAGSGR